MQIKLNALDIKQQANQLLTHYTLYLIWNWNYRFLNYPNSA